MLLGANLAVIVETNSTLISALISTLIGSFADREKGLVSSQRDFMPRRSAIGQERTSPYNYLFSFLFRKWTITFAKKYLMQPLT